MSKFCPECHTELGPPSKRSRYFCPTEDCKVYYIHFDVRGRLKHIVYAGVDVLPRYGHAPSIPLKVLNG